MPGARPRIPEARNGRAPGPGAGGRSDEAYPLHWNNGTPGGRLATLDTPAKTISDTRDSSLLAASYPNYIAISTLLAYT